MIDNPRVQLLIADYGRTLLIASIVLGVLSLVAVGWVVATPTTTTTSQVVGEERIESQVGTSALVVQDGLWEEGDRLEDSSTYLLEDSPVLTLEAETATTATGAIDVDGAAVTHELLLRHEATRGEDVFWEETERLDRTETAAEDGVAVSEASVDVEDVADRQHELEERLGNVGSIETHVELIVEYDTGTNAGELAGSTPLHVSDEAYWLEETESLSSSEEHTETADVEVTEPPNAALVGGLALLTVLSFGVTAIVGRNRSVDVVEARRRLHVRRYAEWISNGSIPMWLGDHHIALDTVEDVVDVAIDANKRVVHDRQRELFAVVSDDVIYYYTESGFWEETIWPEMNLTEGQPGPDADDEQLLTPGSEPPADRPDTDGDFDPGDGLVPDDDFDLDGGYDPDDDDVWDDL